MDGGGVSPGCGDGLNEAEPLARAMRCHECGAPATVAPEHDRVRIGLCEDHLRHYMAEFGQSPSLRALRPDGASA